jgi:N-methylhydantoinase A
VRRSADCRFSGQGYEITVPADGDGPEALRGAFLDMHQRRHGHADASLAVEVVNLRVTAVRAPDGGPVRLGGRAGVGRATPTRRHIALRDSTGPGEAGGAGGATGDVTADAWPLGDLPGGLVIRGPAVLAGPDATGLVEPGWTGTVHECGAVVLGRQAQ